VSFEATKGLIWCRGFGSKREVVPAH